MSRINAITLCAVLVTATFAVGCEDSTTEPAEALSMEETEALYTALAEVSQDTTPEIVSATPDGAVIACPLGGELTAMFEVSDEMAGDTVRLVTDVTMDPDGCVLSSDGYEFTLDGNPSVRTEVTIMIVGFLEAFSVEGSITGGVDWQVEDRSGTCMIDLVISAEPDFSGTVPAVNGGASGTMCDQEVDFPFDVVAPGT